MAAMIPNDEGSVSTRRDLIGKGAVSSWRARSLRRPVGALAPVIGRSNGRRAFNSGSCSAAMPARHRGATIFLSVLLLAVLVSIEPNAARGPGGGEPTARGAQGGSSSAQVRLPATFEPNVGQDPPGVEMSARTPGQALFLGKGEAVFASDAHWPLRMEFIGSAPEVSISGDSVQPGYSNYFLGNDPTHWRTQVPNYSRAIYRGLYPGVDLAFYENQGREIEYDFIVGAGQDPARIVVGFPGVSEVSVDQVGDLVVETPSGPQVHRNPVAYQEIDGRRVEVLADWRVESASRVSFDLGSYEASHPLVIDPVAVSYSTYLGGTGGDYARAITVDASGNSYVTGRTASTNFPTVSPYQTDAGGDDAFIAKIDPAGTSKIYSTYIGGSSHETGASIEVDLAGNVFVAGETESSDFPVVSPSQALSGGGQDAFILNLNSTGSAMTFSTYLGGTWGESAHDIAIDVTGTAVVAGSTNSLNFPTVSALQGALGGTNDAFLAKINPASSTVVYATYWGGSEHDGGASVDLDAAGNAYLVGRAGISSTDFPTVSPFQATSGGLYDAFISKINPTGSAVVYSSFLGGSSTDEAHGVAVDSAGNAYVAGITWSSNFPTVSPFSASQSGGPRDAFITKVNSTGSAIVYSSYLGGPGDDSAEGIVVDTAGKAHLTGFTTSTNFPTAYAFQQTYGGGQDAFYTEVNAAGSAIASSSFLGGTESEMGNGIAIDPVGNVFIAGGVYGSSFPTTASFQPTFAGGTNDAFVTKIAPTASYPKRLNVDSLGYESAGPANRPDVTNSGDRVAFHSPAGDLVIPDMNSAGDIYVMPTATGAIERASVSTGGTVGNASSIVASISPDGRYVAFFSQATNLVGGDTNGVGDVFVRDRVASMTYRVSVSTSGTEANGASRYPQISPDGRYVAFQSEASNLVAGDTNGKWDIFVRDRNAGTTERVSVATGGGEATKASARATISDDGNLVAFHSWADNLIAGDTNSAADVFVRDRSAGTTERLSVATAGPQSDGESLFPKISGNGAAVAFHSLGTNLVAGDTNGARDVFVRTIGGATTFRVSVDGSGGQGNGVSGYADISSDARYVVFHSAATNLVAGDLNGAQDIFVRDRVASTTRRVSLSNAGAQPNGISGMPSISADGTFVAFQSQASNLVLGDANAAQDVFVTPRP